MGAEFVRRAAKTFVKRWDDGRKELGTATLFTIQPSSEGRSAPFEVARNANLHVGEVVVVEKEGAALVARNRLAEVARSLHPPAFLLEAVDRSCGIAKGTVEDLHDAAGVVEISLC
jgi:hypothetical protein